MDVMKTVATQLHRAQQSVVEPKVSARSTVAGSGTGGAAITSTDFMKLLVSEMKNQDPTQPTDPNAYIQQLVGVNSLQQLIAINQELGTAAVTSTPTNANALEQAPVNKL